MSSRIVLITILLVCCNGKTTRATVDWAAGTCQISIAEDTVKDTLYTFTDAPADTNAYSILTQNVKGRFVIASTGVLSSAIDLDYESDQKSYSVQVLRTNAVQTLNANVTCVIQVTDVNDLHPQFVPESFSVDTVNNVAIDASVLTVSATDGDVSPKFNKVEYSIKVEENSANFTINVDTGVISAKTVLAAADPLNLTLKVVATEKNANSFTDEASVRVCVGCKTSGSTSPQISIFASMALVFGVVLM